MVWLVVPLGTLIDWTTPRSRGGRGGSARGGRQNELPAAWRSVKYVLLFTILFAALWGNLTLLILDPLTIFVRTLGAAILPGISWLIEAAEAALYPVSFLQGAIDGFDGLVRDVLVIYPQPLYGGALVVAALFASILALNLVAPRAWCRYFCPLGGLLSLVSRVSWLKRRVSEGDCVRCGRCARECPMGTVDAAHDYASDSGECILCLDCATDCPKDAIAFKGRPGFSGGQPYDPSRRQVLGALGLSLGGVALLQVAPDTARPNPYRLRPPGARESTLLAACLRCGACLRACPTHALQPALTEAGAIGLWTPVVVPRIGSCNYSCTACGDICPSGAIPRLALETKRLTPIGKAYIDPNLCIAWRGRGDCIVCEEMCPLPQKTITLIETTITNEDGSEHVRQLPVVGYERCIGCGLCESKCPVNGPAAIRVRLDPMDMQPG
jgi:ferredoxin